MSAENRTTHCFQMELLARQSGKVLCAVRRQQRIDAKRLPLNVCWVDASIGMT